MAEKFGQKWLRHLDKQEERRYKKEAENLEKEKLEAMKDGESNG